MKRQDSGAARKLAELSEEIDRQFPRCSLPLSRFPSGSWSGLPRIILTAWSGVPGVLAL